MEVVEEQSRYSRGHRSFPPVVDDSNHSIVIVALSMERRDWKMIGSCFTDPVYIDHSEIGLAARDYGRDDFVAIVREAVSIFAATKHLSPNHVIEFDPTDPDTATCYSSSYVQHYRPDDADGSLVLLRGSYTNHMLRTSDGWRIAGQIQYVGWSERRRPRRPNCLFRALPSRVPDRA